MNSIGVYIYIYITLLSWWTFFAAFVYISILALTDVKPFKQWSSTSCTLLCIMEVLLSAMIFDMRFHKSNCLNLLGEFSFLEVRLHHFLPSWMHQEYGSWCWLNTLQIYSDFLFFLRFRLSFLNSLICTAGHCRCKLFVFLFLVYYYFHFF